MKILCVITSIILLLVLTEARYDSLPPHANYDHQVPVIHNGVPVDTPEVQAAKAAHFEAYARAAALAAKKPSNGEYYEQEQQQVQQHHRQQQPLVNYIDYQQQPQHTGYLPYNQYQQQQQQPVQQQNYNFIPQLHHHQRYRRGLYLGSGGYDHHIPTIINGVPQDTPEVQLAKYQHHIAHQVAKSGYGHVDENSLEYGGGHYGIPIITKSGVPLDTPEVQLARRQHLYAHYLEKTGGGSYGNDVGYSKYVPVIGPKGVPYDTVEVQLEKAKHFAAHAKEESPYGSDFSYGTNSLLHH